LAASFYFRSGVFGRLGHGPMVSAAREISVSPTRVMMTEDAKFALGF